MRCCHDPMFWPWYLRDTASQWLQNENSIWRVIDLEIWEKWDNHELVADDYELESLVQDEEGLKLIFLGRKTKVTIVYNEQILSFRSCDESDRWRTVDNV